MKILMLKVLSCYNKIKVFRINYLDRPKKTVFQFFHTHKKPYFRVK